MFHHATSSIYQEYLSQDQLISSLHSGRYLSGKLIVIPNNLSHCYVENEFLPNRDIVITNLEDRNRSQHLDTVVVELYPSEKWVPFSKQKQQQQSQEDNTDAEQVESDLHANDLPLRELWEPKDELLEHFRRPRENDEERHKREYLNSILEQSIALNLQPRGRVVGILPSTSLVPKILTGKISLEENDPNLHDAARGHGHRGQGKKLHQGDPTLLFFPDDARYSPMVVPPHFVSDYSASYKATIGDWPVNSKYPHCGILEINRSTGSIDAELNDLVQNYTVHTGTSTI